jgi:hypothetical protein
VHVPEVIEKGAGHGKDLDEFRKDNGRRRGRVVTFSWIKIGYNQGSQNLGEVP